MRKICILFVMALLLTGCKAAHEIRPDTIVDIPLDPTQPPTENVTQMTEAMTDAPTRPPAPEVPTNPETTPGDVTIPTQPQFRDTAGLEAAVAASIHAARQQNGLPPLAADDQLCAIASVRARESAAHWSDTRPGGGAGITVLNDYGYGYTDAAETLYCGTEGAEAIVRAWMQADHTRARLLMEAETMGVGSYAAPDGDVYVAVLIVG